MPDMIYPYKQRPLKTKLIEHHIERHYEAEADEVIYLQRMTASEDFFWDRLVHCLSIPDLVEVESWLDEEYGTEEVVDEFEFLHHSTFNTFFRDSGVDIPTCFRQTKSTRRPVNETDVLKLNNYLMRHGLREQSWSALRFVLNELTGEYLRGFEFNKNSTVSWRELYLNMNNLAYRNNSPTRYSVINEGKMNFDRSLTAYGKDIDLSWSLTRALMKNITDIAPMFAFYIYRVDKKIFKNTRGKSGKFTFIWKYVTAYKRSHLIMFWLMKELRVRPGRTLRERLHALLHNILFEPKTSWVYRARRFSYNYVYFNCRRTLGESYRTSTK